MRRCEDAKMPPWFVCYTWATIGRAQERGGRERGGGEVLGLLLECLRHSKTLASYDNLSYPSVEKCISKYRYRYSYRWMCVSVVDSFVAWGLSCHKQQQNCYEVCRFVSQIALSLPPSLWGRISVGLCTYLTIIIANHFTLLRLMPLGIGRQGPWDIKALSLSLSCPLSRVCVVYRSSAWFWFWFELAKFGIFFNCLQRAQRAANCMNHNLPQLF